MEIILIKDVENLGYANTLVTVKPGYARNFLIPQGFAIVANKENKDSLMEQIREQEARLAKMTAEAQELAGKIEAATLRIAAKAGTSGKIFGSVTFVQIANALKEEFGLEVDKKKIKMPEEVKMLGKYNAIITLMKDVRATATFEVYNDDPNAVVADEVVDQTEAAAENTEETAE
ncbi:50S ribosomal protein L9 [Saprospira grandis]|uniref:Large ribosomal subunit protein bL9 n=1 Tax=Saprospira grandis (strain Lewin) TaxID=984262 RepID=H6L239_SAPGL|nr:50S ribosomal protein L9 [Saprospira grandis]AFC23576.1 LSU ribosomal protein l9p [Saprospira grandis str. Lewin]